MTFKQKKNNPSPKNIPFRFLVYTFHLRTEPLDIYPSNLPKEIPSLLPHVCDLLRV